MSKPCSSGEEPLSPLERCHFPAINVEYPSSFKASAIVISDLFNCDPGPGLLSLLDTFQSLYHT